MKIKNLAHIKTYALIFLITSIYFTPNPLNGEVIPPSSNDGINQSLNPASTSEQVVIDNKTDKSFHNAPTEQKILPTHNTKLESCSEYITNGGFEDGGEGWYTDTQDNAGITSDSRYVRSGSKAAFLHTKNNHYGRFYKPIQIPSNASSVYVEYSLLPYLDEGENAYVQIWSGNGQQNLWGQTGLTASANNSWYTGKGYIPMNTIRGVNGDIIILLGVDYDADGNDNTSVVFYDDFSMTVCTETEPTPTPRPQATATPSTQTGNAPRRTGESVSAGGNIVVAGSPGFDANGNVDAGTVDIYEFNGSQLIGTKSFAATTLGDTMGKKVTTDGNLIAFSSIGRDQNDKSNSGQIYVARKDASGIWQIITGWAAGYNDDENFGYQLSVGDDTVVATSRVPPKLFVARQTTDGWKTAFGIKGNLNDPYTSVSTDGKTIITGRAGSGTVEAYRKTDAGWDLTKVARVLKMPDDGLDKTNAGFGSSVAVSGNWVIVGAPTMSIGGKGKAGRIYFFKLDDANYYQSFSYQTPEENDYLGASVSLSGNYALVGTPFRDVNNMSNVGQAWTFAVVDGKWKYAATYSGSAQDDQFGSSVSIGSSIIVMGAPGVNNNTGKFGWAKTSTAFQPTGESGGGSGKIFFSFLAKDVEIVCQGECAE